MEFDSATLMNLTGMKAVNRAYWVKSGVLKTLKSGGRGVTHLYGADDVMIGGIINELYLRGFNSVALKKLADSAYAMVDAGRAFPLDHSLLPEVLVEALLMSDERCGQMIDEIADPSTGEMRPARTYAELVEDRRRRGEAPDSRVVEYAKRITLEEAANLDGYFHLTNPAYLRAEDPPNVLWDLYDEGDGFHLLQRKADEPGLLCEGIYASCTTISLTMIARRIWGVEGSNIGNIIPFGRLQ